MSLTKQFALGLIAIFAGIGVLAYSGSLPNFGWYSGLGGLFAIIAGVFVAVITGIALVKKLLNS